MKLYTVVIHCLQMCMKEYGCCPKFGRGGNLTCTLKYVLYVKRSIKILFHSGIVTLTSLSKFLTGTIFLHAHLQAVYYNCVKFHKNPISCLGGVALTRYMPYSY
jgi:hypothetical protein